MKTNDTLGKNIRETRKNQKRTGVSFAKAVNISPGYLHDIETGRTHPSIQVLSAIATALGVTTDYLMGRDDSSDTPPPPPPPAPDNKKTPPAPEKSEGGKTRKIIDLDGPGWMKIPILSREWTACCSNGLPALDLTNADPDSYMIIHRGDLRTYDDLRGPFAIYCEGDCQEEAGINDGDVVAINPAEVPVTNGCLGLVSRSGSLSLKRVYHLPNGSIVLRSDFGDTILTPDQLEDEQFDELGTLVKIEKPKPRALPL